MNFVLLMTEAELVAYLKLHYPRENHGCEWKAFSNLKNSVAGHQGDDIISYVSALANMEGGALVIGVQDGTLNILGISNRHDYTPENLPQRLYGQCTNLSTEGLRVQPFVTTDTNKVVWVLHIPKHYLASRFTHINLPGSGMETA